ncbi:MAG: molybdenum cofactor biosynthesis protein MoaE [Bacteroidales bacterium]|jgi:molybdopterin synthase catalytic subunit
MSEFLIKGSIGIDVIAARITEAGAMKNTGGLNIFIGQVREDIIDGKRVAAIEYSAYDPLVSKEAENIKNEIFSEFNDVKSVVIVHSDGVVKAGQISLFVMVSAGHRSEAISACREAVEKIKARLPVWKKELFGDDTYRWKESDQ